MIAGRDPEKVRLNDRRRHYRNREVRLARMREWAARNREKANQASAVWRLRNPEKRAAHILVGNEKRAGRLVPEPCEVCGSLEVHAHHDDYSKPLEVRWLCPTHHSEYHHAVAA